MFSMTVDRAFLLLLFAHMNVGVVLRTSLHFLRFRFLQHPLTNEKKEDYLRLSPLLPLFLFLNALL